MKSFFRNRGPLWIGLLLMFTARVCVAPFGRSPAFIGAASKHPAAASVTPAFVQYNDFNSDGAATGNQQLLNFSNNVTAGNAMVVAFTCIVAASMTISNNWADTWNVIQSSNSWSGNTAYFWYCMNAHGGATTNTVTLSANSSYRQMAMAEYSGVATSSALDQKAVTNQTSSTSTTLLIPSVTTGSGSELIVEAFSCGGGTPTGAASFTKRNTVNNGWFWADRVLTNAGAIQGVCTNSGTGDQYVGYIATFTHK